MERNGGGKVGIKIESVCFLCIKNTRIAVSDILQWLASGMSNAEILEDYPSLKDEHIKAALMFAARRESMIKIIAA